MRVLVTGGSSGLGLELCREFLRRGAVVVVLDTQECPLEGVRMLKQDVRKTAAVMKLLRRPFDVVVCNAGISLAGDFSQLSADKARDVFEVNVLAHMELLRALVSRHLLVPKARICLVSSAAAFVSWPLAPAYASSKSALDGLALALEGYLYADGVSVTRVYPGPMKTDLQCFFEGLVDGKGVDPARISRRVVRAILWRRRTCHPDLASKLFRLCSRIAPRILTRVMHKRYITRMLAEK